jgi:hypothetical protein
MRLTDKVALVVGGGRGIGGAIALAWTSCNPNESSSTLGKAMTP